MATTRQIYESYQAQYRAAYASLKLVEEKITELEQRLEQNELGEDARQAIEFELNRFRSEKKRLEKRCLEAAKDMLRWEP
jgi:hypothetical protein